VAALLEIARRQHYRLRDQTLGVVGVGNVGSQVVRYAEALGMRVLQNDPPRERREETGGFVPLDAVLDEADILTLHVPLTREGGDRTFHLLDKKKLERLCPGQILINTSRGGVVETGALKSVLEKKGVAACVLDVWENEPDIDRELLASVDLATPHIAGYSVDGKANGTAMSVRAIGRFFGFPLADWYPADLPPPERPTIEIDARNLSPEEVVHAAVFRTCDLVSDDRRLRGSPDRFERQRAEYPPRREFPIHTVSLRHADPETEALLRGIGFRTRDPNE